MINIQIHCAIQFAAEKHTGQVRKGTEVPYIVHPMEVMQILTASGCTDTVIIAGLLHDVLEDTGTKPEEICEHFGEEVLSIVKAESEDKSKSWQERKQRTVDCLLHDSKEIQLVCCADKLSNITSMYADLQNVGNALWGRFNAPKEQIQWYYESILQNLSKIDGYAMKEHLRKNIQEVFFYPA